MERPAFIERIEAGDPELFEQIRPLSNWMMTDGALPAKTKALMTLLGEALLRRDEGVRMVATLARNIGATDAEIRETIRLAFLLGGLPALSAASNSFDAPAR